MCFPQLLWDLLTAEMTMNKTPDMEAKQEKKYGFWNWGTGITITFIVAASFILFLVYKTTTVSLDMAEEDYYTQELQYGRQLEAARNTATLSSPIRVGQNDAFLFIDLPEECKAENASGTLWLYRPSSGKHDLHLAIQSSENGRISVEKDKLLPGIYKLKADWQMNGKDYYQEESFFVEK